MGNQNPEKERMKKRKRKKHHAYAAVVLILAAAIIIFGSVLLFYTQEVEVNGNEYCDSQSIVACVQNDKLSKNSLYVVAKYALGKGKKPECLESIKVKMKNPWTIRINVKEKKIIGYVKKGEKYSCFDQDGLVVNVSDVQTEKIPLVEGLKIKKAELYNKIRTTNQAKLAEILEVCSDSQKYGIYPEKVYVKQQQIYMQFGNINVCLGNQVSEEQIAQIRPILKKLGDKAGTLHLETYSGNHTTITFEMEEISQEN